MYFVVVQTLLLAALAVTFFLRADPALIDMPLYARFLGTTLVGGGVLLAALSFVSLGAATKLGPEPRSPEIVRRGVYRYLRHPMYTSAILATSGLMLIQPRLSVVITGLSVIVFYLFKSRYEERLLLERYPDYATYRAETLGVLLARPRKQNPKAHRE